MSHVFYLSQKFYYLSQKFYNMFQLPNRPAAIRTRMQLDKDGNPLNARPIDQFNSQDFCKSMNGYPGNDITLLARAQTAKEYELLLGRLRDVNLPASNNKGKSDRQIISEMMPEWIQTPAEVDRFMTAWNAQHPDEPLFAPETIQDMKDKKVEVDPSTTPVESE